MSKKRYPWQRRQRAALLVIGILISMVALPFVLNMRVQYEVAKRCQDIRKAGEPVTFSELSQWMPSPAPEKNGAAAYQKAFDAKPADVDKSIMTDYNNQLSEAPRHGRWPDTLLTLGQTVLDTNAQRLALLYKAVEYPEVQFPLDYSQGPAMTLPHLAQFREMARLLALEASLAAHRGDCAQAEKSLGALAVLPDSLRGDPILISQLVRIAIRGIADNAIQRALELCSFSDEQLAALYQTVQRQEDPEALPRAFIVERVRSLSFLNDEGRTQSTCPVPKQDNQPPPANLKARMAQSISRLTGESLRYLDVMQQMIDISRKPIHEALPAMTALKNKQQESSGGFLYFPNCTVSGLFTAIEAFARSAAETRSVATALAVERYRLKNGRLPAALQDLVPEFTEAVPLDPYDGKPLRYRVDGNGYTVYSISINRTDDGGAELENGNKQYRLGDWIFAVQH